MAVLATGHEETTRSGPACYVNPWESPTASGIAPDSTVLIRGTGLTMVDFVVSLRASRHRGTIYAMSRRGLLPQAHRAVAALPINLGRSRLAKALSRSGASCAVCKKTVAKRR